MFQDLVMLSNQCEVTSDYIMGAPVDELPLVEQIPNLHRLGKSAIFYLNENFFDKFSQFQIIPYIRTDYGV